MKSFLAGVVGLTLLVATPIRVSAQEAPNEVPEQASPQAPDEGDAPDVATAAETSEREQDEDQEGEEGDEEAETPAAEEEAAVPAAQDAVDDAAEAAAEPLPEGAPQEAPPAAPAEAAPVEPSVPEVDPDQPFGEGFQPEEDPEFVPLEEIGEGGLEQIVPAKVHPRVEWDGTFRTRVGAAVNYDLDTEGTSAILPPAESFTPAGNPVAPDRDTHWDANLRLKLDPTLHLTEGVRIHTEIDLLDNVMFGSLPASRLGPDLVRPNLSGRVGGSTQLSPREREWFEDAVSVNEVYGQVDTLIGRVSAGRMDSHWGLGIYANDGDCPDCDYGNHLDRFRFETKVWELYGAVNIDFPDEGVTSKSPFREGGQPYDIAQRDDVDQYTFQIFRMARTREEKELQGKRLLDDQLPVFNGGAFYRYRQQEGAFAPFFDGEPFDPLNPGDLVYRGERIHIADLWVQFLYQPSFDTRIRVELEGLFAIGSVDNVTNLPVGQVDGTNVNCFDDDQFSLNEEACTTNVDGEGTRRNVQQFALALESEFQLDSPVSFGFNAGLASGGSTPNWGLSGSPDLEFYRFNPDYHVDLILFRNVIGTVTNAYYLNPYAMVKFLESSSRHLEVQIDAIGSRAFDGLGTPSGQNPWLGLEFDGAFRFVNLDVFTAALEAGILFPFQGLAAVPEQPRLLPFGGNAADFNTELSPRIAWTVQGKLFWTF